MEIAEVADAMVSPGLQETQQRFPSATEKVRLKLDTIQAVIDQCQRALKQLEEPKGVDAEPDDNIGAEGTEMASLSFSDDGSEADALCEMVKSKIDSRGFLDKLGCMNLSSSLTDSAWDILSTEDLLEAKNFGLETKDQDGYVLVNQEDIVEGIASFMAAYLLSLKETKELAPNQLQEALCKTFSVKQKKGKLRKAWEGSQVIYNVASWGATAIGIYQNPAIVKVASVAFWSSCRVISKFL